jgi:hypothetical protein
MLPWSENEVYNERSATRRRATRAAIFFSLSEETPQLFLNGSN